MKFPSLWRTKQPQVAPRPPRVPEGVRVYAFGDVHGRIDLLDEMLQEIERDHAASPQRTIVVGLGDYIDRGPDSRSVLDRLVQGVPGSEWVALRGNHEQMLLDFLERPAEIGPGWLSNGGRDTLHSYGVDERVATGGMRVARDALASRIPPAHLLFLQSTRLSYVSGDYMFVHAGVALGKPSSQQSAEDLLWIRSGFADRDSPFEKVVVHGHTIVEQPYVGRYRIAVDTGAYASGVLSGLVLENVERRILTSSL